MAAVADLRELGVVSAVEELDFQSLIYGGFLGASGALYCGICAQSLPERFADAVYVCLKYRCAGPLIRIRRLLVRKIWLLSDHAVQVLVIARPQSDHLRVRVKSCAIFEIGLHFSAICSVVELIVVYDVHNRLRLLRRRDRADPRAVRDTSSAHLLAVMTPLDDSVEVCAWLKLLLLRHKVFDAGLKIFLTWLLRDTGI